MIPLDMLTVVSDLQSINAASPIDTIESGRVTWFKSEQPLKAMLPIVAIDARSRSHHRLGRLPDPETWCWVEERDWSDSRRGSEETVQSWWYPGHRFVMYNTSPRTILVLVILIPWAASNCMNDYATNIAYSVHFVCNHASLTYMTCDMTYNTHVTFPVGLSSPPETMIP